jgi:hypothetical protein
MTSPIKRTLGLLLLATAMAAPLSLPAAAEDRGHEDRGHYDHRYDRHYGHYDYHRGPGPGVVVGGALLGLGVGAVIGSHLMAPPPVVYAPPPAVVYAPPPAVVYAPPPAVVYAPPPPAYYGN